MNKDKIWYDIPKVGSKTRGGWIYHGYVTSTMELDYELYDLNKKGYYTKTRKRERPDRYDIYYRKKEYTPKSAKRFLK